MTDMISTPEWISEPNKPQTKPRDRNEGLAREVSP